MVLLKNKKTPNLQPWNDYSHCVDATKEVRTFSTANEGKREAVGRYYIYTTKSDSLVAGRHFASAFGQCE